MRAPALVLLAACAPAPVVLERPLSPGDLVVLVSEATSPTTARASARLVDASGSLELEEAPGQELAIAVVRAQDVLSLEGAPMSLEGVSVDLDGDRAGGCGCSAPPLGVEQRIGPGDRCAIPAAVPFVGADGASAEDRVAALRERLRVQWPGACGCEGGPPLERAELSVCVLGEDAERLMPSTTALGPDGTVHAIGRTLVASARIGEARRETVIDPPIGDIVAAVPLRDGGLVVYGNLDDDQQVDRVDIVHVPSGGGRAERLTQLRREVDVDSGFIASDGEVWLVGDAREDGSRVVFQRCDFSGAASAASCVSLPVSVHPECARHTQSTGTGVFAELAPRPDGSPEIAYVHRTGQLYLLRDRSPTCIPGTEELSIVEAADAVVSVFQSLVAIERRLVGCLVATRDGGRRTMVVTATIGERAPRWTTIHETDADRSFCPGVAIVDRGTALVAVDDDRNKARTYVRVGADGRLIERIEKPAVFADLDGLAFGAATSSGALAVTLLNGETWARRAADEPLSQVFGFRRPRGREVRTSVPDANGFTAYAGGSTPVRVEIGAGEGCDAVRLVAEPSAYEGDDEDVDDAALDFGDRRAVFSARGGGSRRLILRDRATGAQLESLPLPPGGDRVRGAVELARGRWIVFNRDDGSLWATDAEQFVSLGEEGYSRLGGRLGVVYAGSGERLARVLVGRDGRPFLEQDVLASIDRASFDAVMRKEPPTLTAIEVLCDGRALVAFAEDIPAPTVVAETTVWVIEPVAGRLAIRPYAPFAIGSSLPLLGQQVYNIAGSGLIPLLSYEGNERGSGLHAPGVAMAALPFSRQANMSSRGADTLVGGPHGRVALVRARRAP